MPTDLTGRTVIVTRLDGSPYPPPPKWANATCVVVEFGAGTWPLVRDLATGEHLRINRAHLFDPLPPADMVAPYADADPLSRAARPGRDNVGVLLGHYATARAEARAELDHAAGRWEEEQPMAAAHAVARAQVHATLASSAATALLAATVAGDPDGVAADQPATPATDA